MTDQDVGKKWSCEYCTYLNFPIAKKCTLCKGPRPPQLITEDVAVPAEQDIYKVASLVASDVDNANSRPNLSLSTSAGHAPSRKWSCHVCTYLNWPRTTKCAQCMTTRRKLSPPASTSRDKTTPLSVNVNICEGQSVAKRLSPNSPEAAKRVNNGLNHVVATRIHGKWNCRACTYENWPRSQKCILCGTAKGKGPTEGVTAACGGSNILENEKAKKTSAKKTSPPLAIKNAENLEIQHQDGAAASPSNRDDNARPEERRLKLLRKRLRENDWLWLNACHGVVAGDSHAIEAYLTSGGDPTRQLSQDEVTLLNRPSAFEIGYTLVHLAIRFQREDMLAVLLTSTDVAAKATKRLPSHVSPDIAGDIKREISTSLRQRKGDFPCFFVTDFVTFALPADIEDLPGPVQKQLFDELLDRDVQNELEVEESIINWSVEITDRLGSRLYSLWNRTAGDCLLDSVLQATWSVFDVDHALRRALSDSLNEGALTFYPRWKEYESMQAQTLQFSLDEAQWQQDWTVLLSLASQPGTALEQTHIFALAHILRRPIIVYGVKYVKSFRGETIGYARFQGVYLPLLWEKSFCWKTPIALGYTRGHFSALVPMDMDTDDTIGAGANIDSNDDGQVAYLPLVDNEGKILPVHFLSRSEMGKEESMMREWMDCCVTKGGILVAMQKLGKRPILVKQMLDEWLDRYRQLARLHTGHPSTSTHSEQTFSSDGETDDE